MSFISASLIAFIAISAILAIPKRTRPLIIPVTALWLIGVAVHDFTHDQPEAGIGLLIVAAGVIAGAIRHRKKYSAQLRG